MKLISVPQVIIQTETTWTDLSLNTTLVPTGNFSQPTGPTAKYAGAISLDNDNYIICGMTIGSFSAQARACHKYNIPGKTTSSLDSMITGRGIFAITKYGDQSDHIFVSGGINDPKAEKHRQSISIILSGQYKNSSPKHFLSRRASIHRRLQLHLLH